ncbi:MAG TPA: sugar ABC transporter ATP-binding protein [Gemmatimonadaceae bacterium]|nr:sugar ABC transporter ATP-binding protein [Gemmatimonadaceae bacterium]
MTAPAVRFSGITKRFPGVTALSEVSFDVDEGSCHAVCGENGAGKSTLGKILSGLISPDAGSIALHGRAVRFESPRDALQAGVAMVHQELALCENMTVAENLCLGALPSRRTFVSRARLHERARALLAEIGADTDPARRLGGLTVAEQQRVQIAAAVGSGARVIVFDEPSSSLAEADALRLYELIGQLKRRGVTILYVSHRMHEIFRLADAVTVLRDGRHVSTDPIGALDEATLVQRMIGRKLEQYFPAHVGGARGKELLRVEGLTHRGRFEDVSFAVHAGEVVGLAGLVGAGRSEVAQALFGLDPDATGTVHLSGKRARVRSPRHAMQLGLGFVPEDRKRQGLVLSLVCRENTTLPTLERLSRYGWIQGRRERAVARQFFERLGVRANLIDAGTSSLSGGNQQKLVLAKWLAAESRVLILDEPTRGVDVGAKAELHAWIDRLASNGAGILLISSELPELLNLSSRILVLRAGRITGEVPRDRATQDLLLRMMAGLTNTEAVA